MTIPLKFKSIECSICKKDMQYKDEYITKYNRVMRMFYCECNNIDCVIVEVPV